MKILFCTSTFQLTTHGPSNFARAIYKINEKFPEHEIRVLTNDIDQEIPHKIYKLTTQYPRPLMAFWVFLDNFSFYQQIKNIQKEYDFDIILFNNAVLGCWAAFRLYRIKVIGMLNDDEYISARLANFRFHKEWFIKFHRKPLEWLAVRFLKTIITNSDYLQEKVIKTYGSNRKKIKRLYKSVNLEQIPFRSFRRIDLNKVITVLFVKADFPRGGLKILIDALSLLNAYRFQLTIIGPSVEYASVILSYFEKSNNTQANFQGPRDQKTVYQAMQTHDLLCIPAHREGLGVVNMEGLAAGIPVISTDIGGIPEVLDKGKNGWLCKANDSVALAKTIHNCLIQEEERKRKAKNGRVFVKQHFDRSSMINNFLHLLSGS